jgi:hypothetical protein
LLPGTAVEIPASLQTNWNSFYVPAIVAAIALKPDAARQLIAVTGASVARNDIQSLAETTIGLLWYNVYGTTDAQTRLGGQPYDNTTRVYAGSSDDPALNDGVVRYHADDAAVAALAAFQTSGGLAVPLVTIHTTGDPIVPFQQEALYASKVMQAGTGARLTQSAIDRFGHCTFQAPELLGAFTSLWQKIGGGAATVATRD